MPTVVDREDVQRLLDEEAAHLVEVLPADEYEDEHIAGAINLPLKQLNATTTSERLDPARPVITYCYDYLCDMNARAAWRLEALGFPRVYRYAPGKADWRAAGLPTEGRRADTPRAGTAARRDVPTCVPGDRVGDAAKRTRDSGWDMCIVVNEERVVLGRLRGAALDFADGRRVDEIMDEGPTTTRADDPLDALVARMRRRNVPAIVVTDPDGRLIGVLRLDDAEPRGD